jgi:predicted nucleic-acid-binding Zn-ribbon protein
MGGFFKAIRKGIQAAASVDLREYEVSGIKAVCPHCKNTLFKSGSAQLNTAGMTYMGLDWANKSASTLVCNNCGNVQWFLNKVKPI